MKVILASASPRRQELLKRIYEDFIVYPADIDETIPDEIGPEFAPVFLAAQKADAVAERFPKDLIISADTIVLLDGEVLGKPKDEDDAFFTLKKLSGKTHKVITGCCISIGSEATCFAEESLVTFFPLTDSEIIQYVKSGEAMGKAGSYGIQDTGALFVEKIDGDFYNIVGLPIAKLKREIDALIKTCSQD